MKHVSVLLHEAIDGLGIKDGDIFVDGTLGSGGHSAEVCRIYGDKVRIIGFDLDGDARKRALTKVFETGCTMTAIAANFRDIKQSLSDIGITHIDRALFDLGISSVQLDDSPVAGAEGQPEGAGELEIQHAVEAVAIAPQAVR